MFIETEKKNAGQNVLLDPSICLDRNGGVLLYHQIEEFIRQKIQSGEWPKGFQLPSEPDLAKAFDVSRATIRQSVFNLVQKGMLERKHGTGTYVLRTAEKERLLGLTFPAKLGMKHKMLDSRIVTPTRDVASALRTVPGEPVGELLRSKVFPDGMVVSIEKHYAKVDLFEKLMSYSDVDLISERLEEKLGYSLINTKLDLRPIVLNAEEAQKLGVNEKDPALMVIRSYNTYHDQSLVYAKNIIKADCCKYLISD